MFPQSIRVHHDEELEGAYRRICTATVASIRGSLCAAQRCQPRVHVAPQKTCNSCRGRRVCTAVTTQAQWPSSSWAWRGQQRERTPPHRVRDSNRSTNYQVARPNFITASMDSRRFAEGEAYFVVCAASCSSKGHARIVNRLSILYLRCPIFVPRVLA